ncbi:MAG: alpha/beta hydrolase [Chloroflexota bacterium]
MTKARRRRDPRVVGLGLLFLLWGLAACAVGEAELPTRKPPVALDIAVSLPPTVSPTAAVSPTPMPPTATFTPTAFLTRTHHPTPTPTASPETCLQHDGEILVTAVPAEMLAEDLAYRVYLPPCYQEHSQARYPVLYLIHGQYFTDDQWDRLGVDEAADRLIRAGEIAPVIIVMPRDRLWNQPERDPFGQAVMDTLIPAIDAQYRTRPERTFRAIGGLSRGGSWALHLGIQYWQSFSAVGAHSAAIFWDDASSIRGWLEEIPSEAMPRFFVDLGDSDRPEISDSALGFEGLLTRLRVPHEFYLFVGDHNEDYWRVHIEQYLRWYTAEWADA